jgi:uncharacterized protein
MIATSGRPHRVSSQLARALALEGQGFGAQPLGVDLIDVIARLGIVQLDAITTVSRSHYLVLLSRCGPFDMAAVDGLLDPQRRVFEQWLHAACLAPVADYGQLGSIIADRVNGPLRYGHRRALGGAAESVIAELRRRLEADGPIAASQLSGNGGRRTEWWSRGVDRAALDALLFLGEAAVVRRRPNFEPVYDLAERVIPVEHRRSCLDLDESRRWIVRRAVDCLGVATATDIADYYRRPLSETKKSIADLVAKGDLIMVDVEDWPQPAFVSNKTLEQPGSVTRQAARRTTLLSPFDNLIWTRDRVLRLFGFRYSNNMYKTARDSSRADGYYVMPILDRGELVGRIDPKVDRRTRTLVVRSVRIEQPSRRTAAAVARIGTAVSELASFAECTSLRLGTVDPPELAGTLSRSWG